MFIALGCRLQEGPIIIAEERKLFFSENEHSVTLSQKGVRMLVNSKCPAQKYPDLQQLSDLK